MNGRSSRADLHRGALPRLLFVTIVCILFASCDGDGPSSPSPLENRPPVIVQQAETSAVVGSSLVLRAWATDADGDSVSYVLKLFLSMEEYTQGYTPDARLAGGTGTFTFRPRPADSPGRTSEFIADDQNGGRDTTRFYVALR
jgi:hypothetical protein